MADPVQVLVVEDEDDIRNLVVMNLKRAGFGVLDAADGAAGLALAKEHRPPVVLLDLMLPDMSGRDICARLRADSDTAHAHVIMVTAMGEERDRLDGFESSSIVYFRSQTLASSRRSGLAFWASGGVIRLGVL